MLHFQGLLNWFGDHQKFVGQLGPWTVAGGPDPDFAETERTMIHALLTDVDLLRCFRARFPEHGELGYDEMVRRLGYVWDCPLDGTANVTGYRCAACVRTRESTQAETWS